jgi:hypothetical protein
MDRQPRIAAMTLFGLTAIRTKQYRCETTTIQEQHDLIACCQMPLDGIDQRRGQALARSMLIEIDEPYIGGSRRTDSSR